MKYTNIKKLLIKFMGGGLINFPTRFLRWIKIDGDAEGDDSGDGGGGDGGDKNIRFVDALMVLNKVPDSLYSPEDGDNFVSAVSHDDNDGHILKQSKPDLFLVFEYKDNIYEYSPNDDLIYLLNTEENSSFIDMPWGANISLYLPELSDNPNPSYDKAKSVEIVSYDELNIDNKKCLIYSLYKAEDFLTEPISLGNQSYTAIQDGQIFQYIGGKYNSIFAIKINNEIYFGYFYGD